METISQKQIDYIDYLKGKLSNYNRDMAYVIARTSLTFKDRGYRVFDLADLQDKKRSLSEKLENIQKRRRDITDEEELNRLKDEIKRLGKRQENIDRLINNGGEELLLGQYNPGNKSITLFVDNLYDAAYNRYDLENLTGYVFVHEMFHAYYDNNCQSVREIEEAMAEYGALSFLNSNNEPVTFDIAKREIIEKQYSCTWTSAYGFGLCIFDDCLFYHSSYPNLAEDYRTAKRSNDSKKTLTSKFAQGFSSGYPFGEEDKYLDLLYKIIKGSHSTVLCKHSTPKALAINYNPLMDAIMNVVSNHSDSIHFVSDIKKMFPKHLMSKGKGAGQIIYAPQDIKKYPTYEASVNGIIYEIHKGGRGWHDHKPQILDHIINNPDNLFTKDDQIELLAAIIKSGI